MTDDLTPYRRGMEFGIGIDSPSADSRNVGVIGEATSIPNASGSLVSFNLTQITSDDDLQTSLGLSASGSMVPNRSASRSPRRCACSATRTPRSLRAARRWSRRTPR